MKTALLVIDVQDSFTQRPHFSGAEMATFLVAQNDLIRGAQALGVPVVRVLHQDLAAPPSDPFSPASGRIKPLEGLIDFDPALTVLKSRHSALVGTGLDVWLVQQGIGRLMISGIRTEQCCETTARHASDMGWQVDFVTEATTTSGLPQPDGSMLSAELIRQRTAAVLRGRFATVTTVAEALHRARAD